MYYQIVPHGFSVGGGGMCHQRVGSRLHQHRLTNPMPKLKHIHYTLYMYIQLIQLFIALKALMCDAMKMHRKYEAGIKFSACYIMCYYYYNAFTWTFTFKHTFNMIYQT